MFFGGGVNEMTEIPKQYQVFWSSGFNTISYYYQSEIQELMRRGDIKSYTLLNG